MPSDMWFMARWLAVPASLNSVVAGTRQHRGKQEMKTNGKPETERNMETSMLCILYPVRAFGLAYRTNVCLGFCMASKCGRPVLIGSTHICKRGSAGISCHSQLAMPLLEGRRHFILRSDVAVQQEVMIRASREESLLEETVAKALHALVLASVYLTGSFTFKYLPTGALRCLSLFLLLFPNPSIQLSNWNRIAYCLSFYYQNQRQQ